jgi:hypothetical protein
LNVSTATAARSLAPAPIADMRKRGGKRGDELSVLDLDSRIIGRRFERAIGDAEIEVCEYRLHEWIQDHWSR